MTEIHLLSAALLLAGMVLYVAAPLLAKPSLVTEAGGGAEEALLQRKARIYQSIRDAELDHDTGKLSAPDHREMVAALKGEAALVLRELDALPRTGAPEKAAAPRRRGRRS